jgi:excisionase family DNA binding protein
MSDVLTVKQAAEYLQINPQTISRKLQHGVLPGRKVGRSYRIRKEDLDEYLKGKPSLGELTPEAQLRLYREVIRQADAEIPAPKLQPIPDTDAATEKALAALGYAGREEQFWIDVGPDNELARRYHDAVAGLPAEDREVFRAAADAYAFNHHLKASRTKRVQERVDELLAAKDYELAPHEDDLPAFVVAHQTGQGLLIPVSKTKEKLESANAARLPRSRAE